MLLLCKFQTSFCTRPSEVQTVFAAGENRLPVPIKFL